MRQLSESGIYNVATTSQNYSKADTVKKGLASFEYKGECRSIDIYPSGGLTVENCWNLFRRIWGESERDIASIAAFKGTSILDKNTLVSGGDYICFRQRYVEPNKTKFEFVPGIFVVDANGVLAGRVLSYDDHIVRVAATADRQLPRVVHYTDSILTSISLRSKWRCAVIPVQPCTDAHDDEMSFTLTNWWDHFAFAHHGMVVGSYLRKVSG